MSANPIPIQFTVPTEVQSQNVYVSITSQLNAPYTNKDGTLAGMIAGVIIPVLAFLSFLAMSVALPHPR